MTYIFEDSRESALSKALLSRLEPRVAERVIFANGNKRALSLLENSGETYAIWLDISPFNAGTVNIYNKAVAKANSGWPIVAVPIINAEYGYIRICSDMGVTDDTETAQECLEFRPEVRTQKFESMCKICVAQHLRACAMVRKRVAPQFLTEDCFSCAGGHSWCNTRLGSKYKLDRYAATFGLMPKCTDDMPGCSVEKVVEVIDNCVLGINKVISNVATESMELISTDWSIVAPLLNLGD